MSHDGLAPIVDKRNDVLISFPGNFTDVLIPIADNDQRC